jgi:hypothetical protein
MFTMAQVNIKLCRPDTVYIIIEKVYRNVLSWGKVTINGKNFGVDAHKVVRQVIQACVAQDYYVDGKRRNGMPSNWDYLKNALGLSKIEGRDKPDAEITPITVYTGWKNIGEAGIGQIVSTGEINLPGGPLQFGNDPVPHIKLYGNGSINFHVPGGKGEPTAIVIYDPRNKTNPITQVPPAEHKNVINRLKTRAKKYR